MAKNFAVVGAGHGGKAMAAHLALMGFNVSLYNRTMSHIEVIKKRGGIELDGDENVPHGFCKLGLVTDQIGEAIKGVEVVMVVLPSSAHAEVAVTMGPYLTDGQIVLLHPGHTCGALEFSKAIRDSGCKADVTIAEAETFIYASRSDGPAAARIFRVKEALPLAALLQLRARHRHVDLALLGDAARACDRWQPGREARGGGDFRDAADAHTAVRRPARRRPCCSSAH